MYLPRAAATHDLEDRKRFAFAQSASVSSRRQCVRIVRTERVAPADHVQLLQCPSSRIADVQEVKVTLGC